MDRQHCSIEGMVSRGWIGRLGPLAKGGLNEHMWVGSYGGCTCPEPGHALSRIWLSTGSGSRAIGCLLMC